MKKVKFVIKNIIKAIIWVTILIILLMFFINFYVVSVGNKNMRTCDTVKDADCILVFGASVRENEVSKTLGKRLDTAYDLYNLKKADKIIVSGDHRTNDYNEVYVMKRYLVKKGVKKEDIYMDHEGIATYDSVLRAKENFNISSAILVSQKEHLVRALYIAYKIGFDCVGVACENYKYEEQNYQKSREFLARIKAFIQCDILNKYSK